MPFGFKLAIGIYPDGNRRFAVSRGLPTAEGFKYGAETAFKTVEAALRLGSIRHIVFFAFSNQQTTRVNGEADAMVRATADLAERLQDLPGVSVGFVGYLEGNLKFLKQLASKKREEFHVDLVVNYSLNWDFSTLPIQSTDVPKLDLVIYTGNQRNLSEFLPLQISRAEIAIFDVLWPEFGEAHLSAAMSQYVAAGRPVWQTGEY